MTMRVVAIAAGLVGLALTGCGEPEPAGGALPPASPVTSAPSVTTANDVVGSDGPFDPDAAMQPDLIVITPAVAEAGEELSVTFPGGRERGVAYVLESSHDGTWRTTHYLTAATDGYGTAPSWVPFGTAGYGWEDIGIDGPGPDTLLVPQPVPAGDYRICTANSVENICTAITIVDDGPATTEPGTAGGDIVALVEVIDDVEYYIGCATDPVMVNGVTWYPVADWGGDVTAALYERIVSVERQPTDGPVGFAPLVAPPGPGDDVGTLYVYADGFAWYESDSGQSIWLTQELLTYTWVC